MQNSRKKLTVVGSGNVGANTAQWAAIRHLADIVMVDVVEGIPQGKALDLWQASSIVRYDVDVMGTQDYAQTADSDVVVITAGSPRKPGMSRDDLLEINTKIVKSVTQEVVKYSPGCVLVVVSNPLDAMTYVASKVSGFEKRRVVGMSGVLDSARFRVFLAEALHCSVRDVSAFVLGGHGDTMVPMIRYSTMAGIPIKSLLPDEKIEEIVDRTQKGGAEIVSLLKTGSAYYAPSSAVIEMVESILYDQKRILPCCAYLNGEYGMNGIYLGVPVYLGAGGTEKVIEIEMTQEEKEALANSAASVKGQIEKVERFLD